jgi:hypothetical protein
MNTFGGFGKEILIGGGSGGTDTEESESLEFFKLLI